MPLNNIPPFAPNKEREKKTLINEQVVRFSDEVRCIGNDGNQFGVIKSRQALQLAIDRNLELVLISPDASPPVAKIMDFGKFKYEQEKRAKEAKKKQKQVEIKEIKLTAKIAQNDLNYKIKHAIEFLAEGKYVKFRVFLKGREMSNPSVGFAVLKSTAQMVEPYATIEKEAFLDGRFVSMHVVPKREKKG
ncbi:MAG: translation initiation factor IF-3 [Helicobacteraceae bacterium]|jgi:translation initiation factor IF-3|nr:translation initiation factor IF-3 [Helicobacteraceae bacterium]